MESSRPGRFSRQGGCGAWLPWAGDRLSVGRILQLWDREVVHGQVGAQRGGEQAMLVGVAFGARPDQLHLRLQRADPATQLWPAGQRRPARRVQHVCVDTIRSLQLSGAQA